MMALVRAPQDTLAAGGTRGGQQHRARNTAQTRPQGAKHLGTRIGRTIRGPISHLVEQSGDNGAAANVRAEHVAISMVMPFESSRLSFVCRRSAAPATACRR